MTVTPGTLVLDPLTKDVNVKIKPDSLGFFITGKQGVWNNLNITVDKQITLAVEEPLPFYHPMHRASHFMSLASSTGAGSNSLDMIDY